MREDRGWVDRMRVRRRRSNILEVMVRRIYI
jgi:hypothetical protein